ncbi:MAG: methionine--tRNA ligase [Candidatus Vogelbacteria bacterium]|nr:methionine--tRNA ligase [Candidatus Vogelbacteria bacterium]
MSKIYLTTTLPYVNADPHIGFALEIIQADVVARFYRSLGDEVFFNFGTDEHGQKIYEKALEAGQDPQVYTDEYAKKFDKLKTILNLTYNNFVRTTDKHHVMAAQEFWKKCVVAGDIYKKNYKIKYCVGCELEKTDSELINCRCPIHPNKDLEEREEENYFFRFSNYQQKLLDLYDKRSDLVVPESRFHEIKKFVECGLEDFSISRLAKKMPWGVPVPGDSEQVMYVWFDALVNYISAISWPDDMAKFNSWWPVIQFAGKDNLRQQSAMWQAMLMSAGIASSKQILIHGFITAGGGVKMSKSLGNVINPFDMVQKYGTDALRYFLLREVNPFEDSPFTEERFKESYNSGLANGLGNLTSRLLKMSESYAVLSPDFRNMELSGEWDKLNSFVRHYEFKAAMDLIWDKIASIDSEIQREKPFIVFKTDPEIAREIVGRLLTELSEIAKALALFMPETSEKILSAIKVNKMPKPLFPRLE